MINDCIVCKEEAFANGVSCEIGKLTENGNIIYPEEGKDHSVQMMIPLCLKCMNFYSEGLISFVNTNGKLAVFEPAEFTKYNQMSDEELNKVIEESLKKLELDKKKVRKQKMLTPLKCAIIIQEARTFKEKIK